MDFRYKYTLGRSLLFISILVLSGCATQTSNMERVKLEKVSNMKAYQTTLNHAQNYVYGRDIKSMTRH